jgi:hypothetical protein
MEVAAVPVAQVTAGFREQMARVAARYYVDPAKGVAEELRFGDRVYYTRIDEHSIGSFLIVHLDHLRATIGARPHHFTYLGLGCADGSPMVPVFRRAKSDLEERLAPGALGVLHLTTRTPYAIRGIEKAFGPEVYPKVLPEDDGDALEIARFLKSELHRHAPCDADESPFLLRDLKQGRFRAEEIARIRSFEGGGPMARFGIDCAGADELIVFHRFAA